MPFNRNPAAIRRQPCTRDCPRRCPGCAVTCPDWAEYLKRREEEYKSRADRVRVKDAIHDGYKRLAKAARPNRY